jgi:hypothetical protein
MYGGDVNKALAKALADNNRLAALSKAHPDLFKQAVTEPGSVPISEPATAAPAVVPEVKAPEPTKPVPVEPPAPSVPPVQVDPQQIAQEVHEAVFSDATARRYIEQFAVNDRTINERVTELQQHAGRVQYLTQKLSDPDLAADEIRKADIKDEIRTEKLELNGSRQEILFLQQQNQMLDSGFRQYRQQIHDSVSSRFHQQANEVAQAAQLQQVEQESFTELATAWPAAIARVATAHNMPPDVLADFKREAKLFVQAKLGNDSGFVVDAASLDTILAPLAKEGMDRLDRYHRQRSAEYAAQAAQRANAPAPQAMIPTAPAPTATPPTDPDAIMDSVRRDFTRAVNARR